MRLLLMALMLAACDSPTAPPPRDLAVDMARPDFAPAPLPDLAPQICTFDVDSFDGDCLLAP
jgi:hypothetical protein